MAPLSESADRWSKKLGPSGEIRGIGDMSGVGDNKELLLSRDDSDVAGLVVKNEVTKLYSAVVLSIKTNKTDRRRASSDSLCYHHQI